MKIGWPTKDLISWISTSITLPLAPFFLGALIRGLFRRSFELSIFDPSELSFSMAMLCLLVLLSSANLNDTHLAKSLMANYAFGIFVFSSLFTLSIIFGELTFAPGGQIYSQSIDFLRKLTMTISLIVVITALMSKQRFKLPNFDL